MGSRRGRFSRVFVKRNRPFAAFSAIFDSASDDLRTPLLDQLHVNDDLAEALRKKAPIAGAFGFDGGDDRIRTGGEGFAGLCLTTWPRRHSVKKYCSRNSRRAQDVFRLFRQRGI